MHAENRVFSLTHHLASGCLLKCHGNLKKKGSIAIHMFKINILHHATLCLNKTYKLVKNRHFFEVFYRGWVSYMHRCEFYTLSFSRVSNSTSP